MRDTVDCDRHVFHRRCASSAHKARTLHTGSRCTFPIGFSWDAIVVRLRWDFRSGVACVPKRNHKIKTPAFQSRGIRQGVHPSQILISNENALSASMLRCHMLILCEKSPSVQPKRKRPGSKSRWTSLHSLACGRGRAGARRCARITALGGGWGSFPHKKVPECNRHRTGGRQPQRRQRLFSRLESGASREQGTDAGQLRWFLPVGRRLP